MTLVVYYDLELHQMNV